MYSFFLLVCSRQRAYIKLAPRPGSVLRLLNKSNLQWQGGPPKYSQETVSCTPSWWQGSHFIWWCRTGWFSMVICWRISFRSPGHKFQAHFEWLLCKVIKGGVGSTNHQSWLKCQKYPATCPTSMHVPPRVGRAVIQQQPSSSLD